jgi:hypothetical protein
MFNPNGRLQQVDHALVGVENGQLASGIRGSAYTRDIVTITSSLPV